ncbi:S41 family peptidase [Lacticaseibacillus zhaodongensis]|uniref:S41 family peptidase n=1 Tax=Lacticaseibacillus zhaodongensis TaxID=2668065 RepID=UPI001E391911|nr:S41 family peptidase [Lacticaseibacillus zhaodongensis]
MNKPKRRIPVWAAVVGMIITLVLGGGIGYFAHQPQSVQVSTNQQIPAGFDKVLKTYATISQNYYRKPSDKKLADGAINGMLKSLDDPFSNYLQNTDATDLNTEISGSFGGIGATMAQTSDGVSVDALNSGSPAQKAGLKVGDTIVSVDGKSMAKKDINAVVSKVRGKIGTKVTVVVSRGNKQLSFTMERSKINVPSVTTSLDKTNKQIGIITFSTFTETSGKQVKNAIKKLRKEGAQKFVLDMRGNPGGVLGEALKIDSMFLKNGQTILKVKPRKGKTEVYKAGREYDKGFKVTEPTVVLIDGNSASASEITAAALNESAGIPLIGTKSYGKGTVQTVADMGQGAELKLTIAKWLTPDGDWINHKGLQPTIKADYPAYAYTPSFTSDSIKPETVSEDAKSLQTVLNALGYNVGKVNGYYGASTMAAVSKFQAANGLTASGTADSNTLSKLTQQLGTKINANDNAMKAAVKELDKK